MLQIPQPELGLNFSFIAPQQCALKNLEQWLFDEGFRFEQAVFLPTDNTGPKDQFFETNDKKPGVKEPDFKKSDFMTTQKHTNEMQFLRLWRGFFQQLLLEVGLPFFALPRLHVSHAKEPNTFLVAVFLPGLDYFPSKLGETINLSMQAFTMMNNTPYSLQAYQQLGNWIMQHIYAPLRHETQAGLSTIHTLKEAYKRKIPFMHLGASVYQFGYGREQRILSKSATDQDSHIGVRQSENKFTSAQRLKAAGLPAPNHFLVQTPEQALQAAKQLGRPVVIKPHNLNRGEGVFIDLKTDNAIIEAFETVKKLSQVALVEQQVDSISYRFFVYDNEVMYVSGGYPRSVCGDGILTVEELLKLDAQAQLKKQPWHRYPAIGLDPETLACLEQQDVSAKTILKHGVLVDIRKIISSQWGRSQTELDTSNIHPENCALAVRAAALFNLTTAGVDLIIKDLSKPWYQQACIINEVNYAPMLGASDVSIASIPKLFDKMFPNNGRIPVEVFWGNDIKKTLKAAQKTQKTYQTKGIACYLTTQSETYGPDYKLHRLAVADFNHRIKALLCDKNVAALMIVLPNQDALKTGFAIDLIDQVHEVV